MKRTISVTLLLLLIMVLGIAVFSCTKQEKKEKIHGKSVEYRADGTVMKGYLARTVEQRGAQPGIIVVHEWWGINKHVRETADRLAELGYAALAVDLFGDGKQAENSEEASELAQSISGAGDVRLKRLKAAIDFLRSQDGVDPKKIAAIGYSFGGNVVLQSALDGLDIDGVVSIYGGFLVKVPESSKNVRARILIMHGEKDWYVTPQMLTAFRMGMKDAGIKYDFITYKDAEHGFDNKESDKLAEKFKGMHIQYNEEAAGKSWEDLKSFLSTLFYQV